MKNLILWVNIGILVFIAQACTKDNTTLAPIVPVPTATCVVRAQSTTLGGNYDNYEYVFDGDGQLQNLKKYIGGGYHILSDSILYGDFQTVRYQGLDYLPEMIILTTDYDGNIRNGNPTSAQVAFTEGLITKIEVFTYFFFYDQKNRLIKVGEQTNHVTTDWEYDLNIYYDDNDNVTALEYEWTTGPRTVVMITADGYDDHPNPFAGTPNWHFLMHASWNNSDPEPIFTALSKNNPLGFTSADGTKRTMTYSYNEDGFPITRNSTNTNTSGSSSFVETFEYECQ